MATATQKQDDKNPGTPEISPSADVQAAERAGISEGDIKALRDDAGMNQSPGHEMDVHAWEQSTQGQEYLKGEKDRVKAEDAKAKEYADALNKDGLNEFEAKYVAAVDDGKAPKD